MTTACVRPALQCLAVWLLLPLLLAPAGVGAQVRITGAIAGTVIDASDAVVPGARVQLIDEGTGVAKETTTGESGSFLFPDLSFGSYRVAVSLDGFQTAPRSEPNDRSDRKSTRRDSSHPGTPY